MERRLAALMAADVVGYSARMAAGEAAALACLARLRGILEQRIDEGGGRLFAAAGDGFMVEFASPVAAVRAAFEIQRDLAARRRREPDTLELRIGVHLADVVAQGDDLLGDGVNVAARIEGLAAPGSVTVSQQVFDQVKRTAALTFENLGEHVLKGIPEPLRLYCVSGEQGHHTYISGAPDAAAGDAPAPPTDRPSIVVLPLTNMSGDKEQDYFADGLTEDLITDLARFKRLFVVSRNASFTYRGRHVDPRRVGRELGTRFCVEGGVRRRRDRVRITAQLIETGSGEHVWADRFEVPLDDLFDLQDEVTARIVVAIVGHAEVHDTAIAQRKRPTDLTAYDCLLRGLAYHRLGGVTREDAEEAVRWFERAIEMDAQFGRAHAWRACAISTRSKWQGIEWWQDPADPIRIVEHALELDENDAEIHRMTGEIALEFGNYDKAERHFLRAIELNPNHAFIVARAARLYNMLGDPERAMEMLDRAKRLDPLLPDYCREGEVVTLYLMKRYADAVGAAALLRRINRRAGAYRTAAAVHLADPGAVRLAADELLRIDADFRSGAFVGSSENYRDPQLAERLTGDLTAAGLPA